ncbi:hypothetical protein OHB12_01015 [Nocardia sp. NBC_01730]|uniref:hypothetical protein n=1 Tax=Nocardia sp. NBC_01730 TaxID=2975998 RepID=UPI002E0FF943|nr:hypothetical protein OHB12_01015 [Nocardia sp. NBC_01730]
MSGASLVEHRTEVLVAINREDTFELRFISSFRRGAPYRRFDGRGEMQLDVIGWPAIGANAYFAVSSTP